MGKVEHIEDQVKALSGDELAAFRRWFAAFDAEVWDRQFEADVAARKLDGAAARAIQDHANGHSTPL